MLGRVVERRVGRQSCEERRLGQRQALGALAEVRPGGLLDPVGAVSEVDRVEVGEQDPILRPALLELPGERRLAHLPRDRSLVADVRVLDELLGDRGATLDDTLRANVLPQRAGDAARVDAVVLVEALSSTETIAWRMIGETSPMFLSSTRLSSPRSTASTERPLEA